MGKKEFKTGLDQLLLGSNSGYEQEIPEVQNIIEEEKEVRATFIIKEVQLNEIKALAYWQRKQIKEIINEAFTLYVSNYPKEDFNIAMNEYKKTRRFKTEM